MQFSWDGASFFFVRYVDRIFLARPLHLPGLGGPWVIYVRFWVLLWSVRGQRNPHWARQRHPWVAPLSAQFPPFKMCLLREGDVMGVCLVLTVCDYVILDIWPETWCRWHFRVSGSVTRFLWCRPRAQRPKLGTFNSVLLLKTHQLMCLSSLSSLEDWFFVISCWKRHHNKSSVGSQDSH